MDPGQPPYLDPTAFDRLRQRMGISGNGATHVPARHASNPAGVAKKQLKRVIRRGIAWYVDGAAQAAAERAARDLEAKLPERESERLVQALTINQELMKAELRSVLDELNDLADAIAPTAGLSGARVRMAELRERINDLDRRTRRITEAAPGPAPGTGATVDTAAPAAPAGSSGFDYLGFERRFRGDSETIVAAQRERYLSVLRDHAPVLDAGCGRGEFVGALGAEGIEAEGVDLDADAVAEAVSRGRAVRLADAVATLRAAPAHHYGGVVSFQVLEHLQLEPLLEMIELSAARLKPGGVFIAETPNPASLIVLGNSYILDPTHVRPLHPLLLIFLCERAGFRDVEVRFFEPASAYQLPLLPDDGLPEWATNINVALTRLNDVLFGPQDYAVIARAPSSA
ncbi:MAG TPA: class I SAM-dependent methyltransferase [Candidatus Dormibacteraeota bacterium]